MLRGIYGDPDRFARHTGVSGPMACTSPATAHIATTMASTGCSDASTMYSMSRGIGIGTMEVESALVDHPRSRKRLSSAVHTRSKARRLPRSSRSRKGKHSPELADELKEHVVRKIGAIARPDQILFSADLPKTRSGKIMRRLLRDIAEGKALGDTTTLADPAVVARLKGENEEKEG